MRPSRFILLLVVLAACGPKQVPQASSKSDINRYDEDVSAFRPTYPAPDMEPAASKPSANRTPEKVIPQLAVTEKVETMLDTLAIRNKAHRFTQGYRVQIYSGTDRKEAENAKVQSYQLFPNITPYLTFTQPTYRVKVGDFLDRIEAEKYCAAFKQTYPTALVVAEKVDIKRNIQKVADSK